MIHTVDNRMTKVEKAIEKAIAFFKDYYYYSGRKGSYKDPRWIECTESVEKYMKEWNDNGYHASLTDITSHLGCGEEVERKFAETVISYLSDELDAEDEDKNND